MSFEIDAGGMHYTELNQRIRRSIEEGNTDIYIKNVMGQRFIGDGLAKNVTITVEGVPGGDLGMFMKGPQIIVYGNADHAPGNTMDNGLIVVHGSSGDATSHSMRGGRVYIRDSIGYRGGIHMKQYKDKRPILIIGGSAHAFLGEYMAGGLIIMLRIGQDLSESFAEMGIASGIHGGEIFIRGTIAEWALGIGSSVKKASSEELASIKEYIIDFCKKFEIDPNPLLSSDYSRIAPVSARPFANKYTWE